jgi:NTE family protein
VNKCLAFVLSGGGARGALQVGALRALFEAGVKPDLLVGTSIGAANSAVLALHGVDMVGLDALEQLYDDVANSNLMDSNLIPLAVRALAGRPNHDGSRRVTEFLVAKGASPDLHFGDIRDVRVGLVGADLQDGRVFIYGQDPDQSVLEGVLASTAVPPWFAPVEREGHLMLDGGTLSNLPIEPALTMGATEIIALDLYDPRPSIGKGRPQEQYVAWVLAALGTRHTYLEMELAKARGVPVRYINLRGRLVTPIWNFAGYRELIATGYETAASQIEAWRREGQYGLAQPAAPATV